MPVNNDWVYEMVLMMNQGFKPVVKTRKYVLQLRQSITVKHHARLFPKG